MQASGGSEVGRAVCGRITTLKRRADFLAARKGARWATQLFVLEALRRSPETQAPSQAQAQPQAQPHSQRADASGPRFGFTVSKQVGGAVERNRIKRRLRAAVQQTQAQHARPDFDYVLIARRPALQADFSALVSDLVTAYGRVHSGRRPSPGRGRRQA